MRACGRGTNNGRTANLSALHLDGAFLQQLGETVVPNPAKHGTRDQAFGREVDEYRGGFTVRKCVPVWHRDTTPQR